MSMAGLRSRLIYPVLEKMMEERGLQQMDCAAVWGCSNANVAQILHGKRRLSFDRAIELRDALFPGMNLEELFRKEKEE